ncbi:hypothetical protein [Halorussus amylolyticus]|uniref:hypothetical protein n=1 Tax=Halorussus amylolyticus TaxID=1126242 RepID=UPI001049A3A1|nr:hypothetical protein [Halorussus amylolyticus]
METGGADTVFGIERLELWLILLGVGLVAVASWVANDATGTMRVASTGVTALVALVVATVMVRYLD